MLDEGQAHRDRPADVDPQELRVGDVARVARNEIQPPQLQPEAAQDHRYERPARRGGELHPAGGEDGADHLQALVDVAADQELLGGAALELEGLAAARRRGLQVVARGLGALARVGQGLGHSHLELEAVHREGRAQLEGPAIEHGRVVEGEGVARLPGREGRVGSGPAAVAGPQVVLEERLRVVEAPRFEGLGQALVDPPHRLRLQQGGQRLPDAVVEDLDLRRRAARAHELGGAQRGQERALVRVLPRRQVDEPRVHRTRGHRQRLEQGPRARRQQLHPRLEHLGQGDAGRRPAGVGEGVARELLDQERAARRLAHDRVDEVVAGRLLDLEQLRREGPRRLGGQGLHGQRPAALVAGAREERLQERLGLDLLAAEAGDEQQGSGWACGGLRGRRGCRRRTTAGRRCRGRGAAGRPRARAARRGRRRRGAAPPAGPGSRGRAGERRPPTPRAASPGTGGRGSSRRAA